MRRLLLAALCVVWLPALAGAAEGDPLARIGFGSCAQQDKPQPIWDSIVAVDPQLFLLLGDNIYGDTDDMQVLRAKYQQLGAQPGFQKLRKLCPLLATWDDHDLGANDAGGEYPHKKESQEVFLDFFEAKKEDIRRVRPGVYSVHYFGQPGKRVQVILLDTRYFRSLLKGGFQAGERGEGRQGSYAPNNDPQATVLGDTQWSWLAEQLKAPAELRLLCSSFQVIPDEHGWECWANFPLERARLLKLLADSRARGVVLLSGDRHLAEISRLAAGATQGIGYPLYEVTSSSLNKPSGGTTKAKTRFTNEINSYRIGLTYFETNFGFIEVDWSQSDPTVRLQVRDEAGDVAMQQRLRLGELRPKH